MTRRIAVVVVCMLFSFSLSSCRPRNAPKPVLSYASGNVSLMARTSGRDFEVYNSGTWTKLVIKGVNVGTSLPGRWYTQFPANRALYRSWLQDMASLQVNVVRLYTLLDPAFYQVFLEYNSNPANPRIWLMQEIWPHDEVPEHNFHDDSYRAAYERELRLVIDALHGNADIPGRAHRAYGNYSADVSHYVLGLLIGREFEPEEVRATNQLNPHVTTHEGKYIEANAASPTEVWLAVMCDTAMAYASTTYSWQYPVGFVSWPTLDPLVHVSEWDHETVPQGPAYNDREEVRPDRFTVGAGNAAGLFGAYHIYPNYPDFMNNEPDFSNFSDAEGTFRYIGYLKEFMSIHPEYPAVVAEFGISTSLNTAHKNPDGLNHGGLSEDDQGRLIVRMMRAIIAEGYAGGLIFEWTDEWAKKTWNTEPYMVPWERQVLWKNAMDPEQNYGLVSMEPSTKPFQGQQFRVPMTLSEDVRHEGRLASMEADADEAFLYLSVGVDSVLKDGQVDWDKYDLMIGIDTARREAGEFRIPLAGVPGLPTGVEFLVAINSPNDAAILVVPSYNRGKFSFFAEATDRGEFTRIETIVNRERFTRDSTRIAPLYEDESKLRYGVFDASHPQYSSLAHWYVDTASQRIIIRLPWMLLNVSDPSSGMVINDPTRYLTHPVRDQLRIEKTEGFLFYAVLSTPSGVDVQPQAGGRFVSAPPYLWRLWEEPSYVARLKKSYRIIGDYFGSLK